MGYCVHLCIRFTLRLYLLASHLLHFALYHYGVLVDCVHQLVAYLVRRILVLITCKLMRAISKLAKNFLRCLMRIRSKAVNDALGCFDLFTTHFSLVQVVLSSANPRKLRCAMIRWRVWVKNIAFCSIGALSKSSWWRVLVLRDTLWRTKKD